MRGRRRAVALAVLLPLLEPAAVGLSAWAATLPHECADHSCLCTARRCPPKRSAAGCHKESAREAAMTGGCHRGEAAKVGAITPYVLPAPAETGPAWGDGPAVAFVVDDTHPGFSRLDSPPPRSL
jgi:hypothetical protein